MNTSPLSLHNFGPSMKHVWRMKFPPFRIPHSAFTLLEILVTIALFSILAIVLFSVVQSATDLWRENERRVDSFREARAALNVISSDLRAAVSNVGRSGISKQIPTLLANVTSTNSSVGSLPSDTKGGNLFVHSRLALQSQPPGRAKSNLCQLGYYLAFSPDISLGISGSTTGSYKLFRFFLPSETTFTSLRAFFIDNQPLFNINNTLAITEPLAYAIHNFEVKIIDPENFQVLTEAEIYKQVIVEIQITSLNNDFARRFETKSEWDDAENHADFVRNARLFTTKIFVPAAMLDD